MQQNFLQNTALYLLLNSLDKEQRRNLTNLIIASIDSKHKQSCTIRKIIKTYLKHIESSDSLTKEILIKETNMSSKKLNRYLSYTYSKAEFFLPIVLEEQQIYSSLKAVSFFVEKKLFNKARERLNIINRKYKIEEKSSSINPNEIFWYLKLCLASSLNVKNNQYYLHLLNSSLNSLHCNEYVFLFYHNLTSLREFCLPINEICLIPNSYKSLWPMPNDIKCCLLIHSGLEAKSSSEFIDTQERVVALLTDMNADSKSYIINCLINEYINYFTCNTPEKNKFTTLYLEHLGILLNSTVLVRKINLKTISDFIYLSTFCKNSETRDFTSLLDNKTGIEFNRESFFVIQVYTNYKLYLEGILSIEELTKLVKTSLPRNTPPHYAFFYYYTVIRYCFEVGDLHVAYLEKKIAALNSYLHSIKQKFRINRSYFLKMKNFCFFIKKWVFLNPGEKSKRRGLIKKFKSTAPLDIAYYYWLEEVYLN